MKLGNAIIINCFYYSWTTKCWLASILLLAPATHALRLQLSQTSITMISRPTSSLQTFQEASPPRPKVLSAEISPKKGSVPTVKSANSLMDPKNSASIWRPIAPTRLRAATLSRKRDTAATARAATSSMSSKGWPIPLRSGPPSTIIIERRLKGLRAERSRGCCSYLQGDGAYELIFIFLPNWTIYPLEVE